MGPQLFGRGRVQPAPTWLEAQDGKIKARRRCCRRRPPLPFCMAWSCFCLFLIFGYRMSRPALPQSSRFIGYQAYEKITSSFKAQQDVLVGGTESNKNSSQSTGDNVPAMDTSAGPSYPLDVYAPIVHNTVPLTDITVRSCSPLLLANCKPYTTPEADARLGPWVRVERPLDAVTAETRSLSKVSGWAIPGPDIFGKIAAALETNYLFYRRSRRSDAPHVVDLKIVDSDDVNATESVIGWSFAPADLRMNKLQFHSSKIKRRLFYRRVGGSSMESFPAPASPIDYNPITEIDVLYGPGPLWPGFDLVGEVEPADEIALRPKVTLAARRKPQSLPELPVEPRFRQDGTFTIMQIADLHLSVMHGKCRDVSWESNETPCIGDNDTLKLVNRWLDEEKPDLVVFSGDQLNGQTTSWDERSVIPKWVQPIIDRKIPWASIQGNHDSQSGVMSRREQQQLLSTLPYSYTRAGPAHLHDGTGAGNFYLKLKSPTPDAMHLFTLYFMDSGAYAPPDMWHPFKFTGYDWIRDDQRQWFAAVSDRIAKIARPYLPDGAKDLDKLWDRRGSHERAAQTEDAQGLQPPHSNDKATTAGKTWSTGDKSHLSKPKAIVYVHIPVPEMVNLVDKDAKGNPLRFGDRRETVDVEGAQKKKGIFMDALLRNKENSGQDSEVVAFLHGHMHNNHDCQRTDGIWICFNGGSSFAGYGDRQLERRTRVIRLSHWGEQVDTWSRLEKTPGRVQEHMLYSEDASKPISVT